MTIVIQLVFTSSVFNFFTSTLKCKVGVFKFLQFARVFQKLRFRDGLVWTVLRPNRRNKASFS